MIDTGADISCISQSFLAKVTVGKPKLQLAHIYSILGVGSQRLRVLGKINLMVQINDKCFNFDFHVIDSLPHSLIIGIDFLQMNNVTINLSQKSMHLSDKHAKVCLLETKAGLARCTEKCIIPANSEAIIPVHITRQVKGKNVLLEATPNLKDKQIMAARCIVTVQKGKSVIRVINPSSKSVYLPKRYVVAKVIDADLNAMQTLNTDKGINTIKSTDRPTRENLNFNLEDADLTPEQKGRLIKFLKDNKHVFATNLKELGVTDIYQHKIETGDAPPVRMPFYRQPPHLQKETDRQIQEMLDNNIIQTSMSPWHSPVVLVRKRCGTYRFAVDYRKLNSVTHSISFPLPRLDCVFDAIGAARAQIFSVLDLASGFWQIPMDPSTRHKAAFITQSGIYEWLRLPFGLSNSPASFSMVMAQVLRGINWKFVLCYVDDILVFSDSFESHLDHLGQVFSCLTKANLTLKPSKCNFAVKEVKYLGHIITKDGVKVDPDKTSAVSTFPVPKTQQEVRSFLGMCNYYRKFVKSYSNIASPLTNLLRKDEPFKWTDKCQDAFTNLKKRLTSAPILAYADMNKTFTITCDASDTAIGYILSQEDDQRRSRVIAYGGRSLSHTEKRYHTTEKECLAIVNAIKANDTYLAHNRFIIYTDHKALCWLQNTKHKSGRLSRWAMALQHYNFEIKHIKGKENFCADALSRRKYPDEHPDQDQMEDGPKDTSVLPMKTTPREITEVHFFYDNDQDTVVAAIQDELLVQQIEDRTDLITLQKECPDFEYIYAYLEKGTLPEGNKLARKTVIEAQQYSLLNGILYHWYQRRAKKLTEEMRQHQQIALPKVLRENALLAYHDSQSGGAHLATKRVYEALRLKYFWPRMHQQVDDYVRSCDRCQRIKTRNQNHKAPLTPMPVVDTFDRWHIDILELTQTKDGYRYVLLVVDSFSKWSEAFAIKTQDASVIAKVLYEEIFTRYGCPKVLLSDRGQAFMSKLVSALCEIFHVKRHYTSSYHPQTNSTVERQNSTLAQCLRAYCRKDHNNWPSLLPGIMMAFRMSPSTESTEYSPYYLLFGKEMNLPFDVAVTPKENMGRAAKEHIAEVIDNLKIAKKIASNNVTRHQEINKENYDKKTKEPEFRIGQRVLIRVYKTPVGLSRKLQDKSDGPYYISDIGPNHTYRLVHCQTHKPMKSLINAQHLRLYHDPRPYRSQEENQTPQPNRNVDQADGDTQDEMPNPPANERIEEVDDIPFNESDTESEKEEPEMYDVERLLGKKTINGKVHYKCKWTDGSPSTWEPEENITEKLIQEYHIHYTQQGKRRKKRRKQGYRYFRATQAS